VGEFPGFSKSFPPGHKNSGNLPENPNLAKCVDGINSFVCICPPGVSGARCEINDNDCDPDPCQNGGVCHDGVNSFLCVCEGNFTGSLCSVSTISSIHTSSVTPPTSTSPRTNSSAFTSAPITELSSGEDMMSWGKYFFPIVFAILVILALIGWKLGWWSTLFKAKPPSHLKSKQDPPSLSRGKSAGERKKRVDSLKDDGSDLSPKTKLSVSKHAGVNVFFEGRSRSGHDLNQPNEPIDYEKAKRDAIGASRDPTEIKIDDPHRPRDVFPAQRSRADEALPTVPEL